MKSTSDALASRPLTPPCATHPAHRAARDADVRERHGSHPADLHDGHQRNRGEVQHEAGRGHPRKDERTDRQQRNLRAHRGRKQADWREQPRRQARRAASASTCRR